MLRPVDAKGKDMVLRTGARVRSPKAPKASKTLKSEALSLFMGVYESRPLV